jgi:YVTN family beta-propeller protein
MEEIMRSLRTVAMTLGFVFLAISTSQAKTITNYAYATDFWGGKVNAIRTSDNTVVATIPTSSPWGVAVDAAGTVACVTNYYAGTVSLINTKTNAVTGTIQVGGGPLGVAFAPKGANAYVANGNSDSVSVINTTTKAVLETIQVGNYPYSIVVSPDGKYVYVGNSNSGSVSVISVGKKKVVATIPVGGGVGFLSISTDGLTVYAPTFNNTGSADAIALIDTAHNTVVNRLYVDGAWGAKVSPDGQWLYASDYIEGQGNLVTVISTATQAVAATIQVGASPEEVAFTADGSTAYVTNGNSGNISIIDTASFTVVNTINTGSYPIGMAVMGGR